MKISESPKRDVGIYTPERVTLTFFPFSINKNHKMVVTLTGHVVNHKEASMNAFNLAVNGTTTSKHQSKQKI